MALADFDAHIYEAEASHSNLYSIFFDMENTFPRIWTHRICSILHQLGLRGSFRTLLQNYLKNRTFRVKAVPIPQESPLSGTLFLIAINELTETIKTPLHSILFSGDLSVHLRSSNPQHAHRLLQNKINEIHNGLSLRGFRNSAV